MTDSQPVPQDIPTIRAVARQAGVSTTTVSRVLNDAPYVRPETRSRVMEAIAGLHYRPNAIAQSLTTGRSRVIGVIVADLRDPVLHHDRECHPEPGAPRGLPHPGCQHR